MARTYKGELSSTHALLGLLAEQPGASASTIGSELKKRFQRARYDSATAYKMLPKHAERGLVQRIDAAEDMPSRADDRYVLLDPGRLIVEDLMYAAPVAEPPRRDALYARLKLCRPQRLPALIARKEGEIVVLESAFLEYKDELLRREANQGDWRTEMDVVQLDYLSQSTLSKIHRLRRVIDQLREISGTAGQGSADVMTNAFCEDGELSASIAVLAVVTGNPNAEVSTIARELCERFGFAPFTSRTAYNAIETLEAHGLVWRHARSKKVRAEDRVEPTDEGAAALEEWMYTVPVDVPPVRDSLCGRLELCQPENLPRVTTQVTNEAAVFAEAFVAHRNNLRACEKLLAPGNFRAEIDVVQLEYRAQYALDRTRRLHHVKERLETFLADSA
jgi:DNA-binding PadR family transcriptional regulator